MASNRHVTQLKLCLVGLLLAACGGGHSHSDVNDDAVDSTDAPDDGPILDAAGLDGSATDGQPSGPDPSTMGSATVSMQTATIPGTNGRSLASTIFTPSAPTVARPLVVILPGFQLARTQYTSYAQHLASWGFVVILADYGDASFSPDHAVLAADVSKVLDYAVASTPLAIDATKIGIAGHSLGGKISVLAAAQEPRIKAVVGWDPVDSSTNPAAPQAVMTLTAPLAVIGETTDGTGGMPCAPEAENFLQFYAAAKAPAVALTLIGADHMDFVDDPSCFFCGFCTAGTAAPALARTATKRLDVAWFRRQLLGDATMDAWLYAPPEVAAGTVTVQHR